MITLLYQTPSSWAELVLDDFDSFLLDHAMAEKKASGMAMSMVSHYPDKSELVARMIELAIEELTHFRAVTKLITERGGQLGPDQKDPYIKQIRQSIRHGREQFLLDRLLVGGVVEARGAERFGLVADALEAGPLKRFYRSITRSEENHKNLFVKLALRYLPEDTVHARLSELLEIEAGIVRTLPQRAALH
jgi:tRNA-(ms[2]io[6]A)-hydroxylase